MNARIQDLFSTREKILSIFLTVGYPTLQDTVPLCVELAELGVGMIELGMPFSDPIAEGATIQRTSEVAIKNGVTLSIVLEQLREVRKQVPVPLFLMGYLNPVFQYGVERFLDDAAEAGADGLILPDLPAFEYEKRCRERYRSNELSSVFLVTPHTSVERIQYLDSLSDGFLYAVSSAAITGGSFNLDTERAEYFKRISEMKLRNPVMVGFGIDSRERFKEVCCFARGGIIGSAFLRALGEGVSPVKACRAFIQEVMQP